MYTLERIYTKPLDLAIFFEHSEMAAHFGIARWSFQEYNTRIVHCNTVIYLSNYLSIYIHPYISSAGEEEVAKYRKFLEKTQNLKNTL